VVVAKGLLIWETRLARHKSGSEAVTFQKVGKENGIGLRSAVINYRRAEENGRKGKCPEPRATSL
jgi:hypothetical protein